MTIKVESHVRCCCGDEDVGFTLATFNNLSDERGFAFNEKAAMLNNDIPCSPGKSKAFIWSMFRVLSSVIEDFMVLEVLLFNMPS